MMTCPKCKNALGNGSLANFLDENNNATFGVSSRFVYICEDCNIKYIKKPIKEVLV